MSYSPPAHGAIQFNFIGTSYTPTAHGLLRFWFKRRRLSFTLK